jgi:DNA-binding transcriptional MerR regulator
MASLTVSTLAKQAGVRPDTIRYYERAGLLPPPARSPAGYRQYDAATIDRLHFIRGAQRLGLRLARSQTCLPCATVPLSCPCAALSVPRWCP